MLLKEAVLEKAVTDDSRLENDIKKIKEIFARHQCRGSREEVVSALNRFEQDTSGFLYKGHSFLTAVIKWHKNIFLQRAKYFSRAEELLDEALGIFDSVESTLYTRWCVKVYISLGYVHRAQWNYIDSDFYLKEAEELALTEPAAEKFLGEIYSLLSIVNIYLNNYARAREYSIQERDISYRLHVENSGDSSLSIVYAYSLVNYCRVNRMIDLVDYSGDQMLDEAVSIFSNLNYAKGLLRARLEKAQMQYLLNMVEQAQERALLMEGVFKERGMFVEFVEAGLLAAKVYRKLYEYELAEKKLKDLFLVAHYHGLEQEYIVGEALYQMGLIYYATNRENKALEYFRRSAKTGMILGMKSSIIKPFNAARKIDKYKARDLLSCELVYRDSMFVNTKMERTVNPFSTARTKVKLYATTMFVDIVGFSKLMKRSDEDLTVTIIDELIDRLCQIIYQHDGYIDKFLGDGFMVIFEHGHGLKFESAFNALKAGVDIYRALKHKNRKLKKAYGVDNNINVRMGVSTGEIYALLLGNFIKTEFTYLGNSVNLASKLESQASNQLMLIDEDTHNMVKDMIVSDPKHLTIQGMGDVTAYKVFRLARKQRRGATTARMSPEKLKKIVSSEPKL